MDLSTNPKTPHFQAVRKFIGWEKPILQSATEQLFAAYARGVNWDMRQQVVVLPSGLAKRRLAEMLAIKAEQHGLILYPPQIVTVGALPEHLYVAKFPFASEVVQHLAWMRALQETTPQELQTLVPIPPTRTMTLQWLELGKMLAAIHRELASDRLNFGQVAEALGRHAERTRWDALASIQQRYLQILDGLNLWDIQTARLCALQYQESKTAKQVLVIGCVDLNRTQRGFLEAIGEHVEIWIAAPEAQQAYFDEFGCLERHAWETFELNLPTELLLVGNSPMDQAELTAACLAEVGNRYHAREVTIGVPDSSLITELKHQLDLHGLKARYGPGTALAQSEPGMLLSLIGKYIESRSYGAFATLVRHPAFGNLLRVAKADVPDHWLALLDDYYQATLPKRLDGFVNLEADGAQVFVAVTKAIDRWLSKLGAKPQAISSFVQPLLAILSAAYDKQTCDLDDPDEAPLFTAASQTCAAIVALRDIPTALQPKLSAAELIDWLIGNMAGKLVPEPTNALSVEMLGWLELALDDSPVLVVTGMHDGVVPESVNSDAFLPNNLRRQLGMMDNQRRYARDMYSLQIMLHTREYLRIVVGKTNESGDPLVPSRLLMACPLDQLPARVLHLVKEEEVDVLPAVSRRWLQRGGTSQLEIPHPADVPPPTQISVTAFRDYLKCPYRFYLRHVLKLRSEEDSLAELDAPQFGVLLHDALAMLQGPIGSSTDAAEIQQFLIGHLQAVAERTYGSNPAAAVLIQIEQAELRLAAFAAKQAERAAQGWEIRFVEQGVDRRGQVLIGNEPQLSLIGRIDRIDFQPSTGQWAIWDYKTSESAKNPVAVHWTKKNGWQDLQLPLYRSIAKVLGVTGEPSLGYIAIPKQASDCGFQVANFSSAQLREADQQAGEIASRIAKGDFWPDSIAAVAYDDFARICQSNVQRVAVNPPARKLNRTSEAALGLVPAATVMEAKRHLDAPVCSDPSLPPLLIRASAGTGKTFQLSNRLLQIILSGQDFDSILATTFTRKAAGEIMHRVLQRLAVGCVDLKAQAELSEHLSGVDTSAANCLAALRRLTSSIHRLRIGTLDSFFAQVARTFSLEIGLPPGWHAMDPVQEPQFQLQSISRMLETHERKTLVDLVRMLAKGESVRQVADQIRQTVASGYGPYRITGPEAWDQLPLPTPPSEAAVESALRTVTSTKLMNKSADLQLEKLHLDASTGNWEALITHGIYSKLQGDPPSYYRRELPADLVLALKILAERAAAELLPIRRNQTLASYKVLQAYDLEYSALIRQYRLLAFSDVTYYLSRWMSVDHDAAQTLAADRARARLEFRLDCGIHHLLLDEFQDTAPEQWRILEPLATPLADEPTSRKSIFCVGDTKQAIYGWRGGVAEVFDSVTSTMPAIQQQELRDSFRSSPEVISTVNEVFSNLSRHSNFSDCDGVAENWSRTFPEHRTARGLLKGYVRLQNGPKVASELTGVEKRQVFLEYTAQQIADLTSKSDATVGVLFRTNADVARLIAILRDKGVSASQDGGNPLTDSAAVELILSLVHLADHPGDGVCMFHVATSPLAAQLPYCDQLYVRAAGKGNASHQSNASRLAAWFRREVARHGLGATIESVADMLANQLSWWDQHRLVQLIRLAHQAQNSYSGRLRDFEEAVEFQRVALPTEAQVKVMTVHKSKGLEFDAVFLPDLEIDLSDSNSLLVLRGKDPCQPPDGVLRYMNASLQAMLPESWQRAFSQHKQRGMIESLCLLYVAMTRAKSALIMTARPTNSKPSQEFGSLLQSTLGSPELTPAAETSLFETGDVNWHLAFPKDQHPLDSSSDPLLQMALRVDADSAPVRGLKVAAPSSISRTFEPIPLSSAFSYSQSIGATYGTIIHAFFEQIQWLDDYRVEPESLRQIALAAVSPEELQQISMERAIEDFTEMLELGSVRAALSRARYRQQPFGINPDVIEIDNERIISLLMDGRLISGTIDRLAILMKDGQPFAAEIIDFKTDAFDSNLSLLWLDDRVEHHRPQLEVYSQVVSRLFRIPSERIATYLLMLSTDDFVRVDRRVKAPHLWETAQSVQT